MGSLSAYIGLTPAPVDIFSLSKPSLDNFALMTVSLAFCGRQLASLISQIQNAINDVDAAVRFP